MEMPRLQIDSTPVKLGLETHQPPMEMAQRDADVRIATDLHGAFHIEHYDPQLSIDQSAAFADADLKGPLQRTAEHAARARQSALQFVAETARHGEMLKRIEDGVEAIPEIAREKGTRAPKEANYAQVPSGTEKVQIDIEPGGVDFHVARAEAQIDVETHEVELSIPRWETNTYVEQKNQLHISVAGSHVNRQL